MAWYCQFTSKLTFIRFPVLKHHPYLEAFQGKSGWGRNRVKTINMHPPLVSSSFFFIDCHNSQYRYSKFFLMFRCCCSPPCCLRLLFSGSAVLWFPKTPVTARDLEAEDLGSVSAWFRELAGNGCLPFPALAIIGAPHLSMACLPKLIGFLSKWWPSKSVKIWSRDWHCKVKMRGRVKEYASYKLLISTAAWNINFAH